MTTTTAATEAGPSGAASPPAPADAQGRLVIIVNPASGSATSAEELLSKFGSRASGREVTLSPTTEDDPGIGQARDAVAAGAAIVVACGGDGTVRAVLESVANTPSTLAVVPLGTGNLLAANLALPTDVDEAVDLAVSGTARRIDVGVVNDERFAVMAGVGFDAAMIRDASSTAKRRFGSAAYVASAIKNMPAQLVRAVVRVDGEVVWHGRTAMVLVGNCGQVSGGLRVFPGADHCDGRLDVAVLAARNIRQWASVLTRLALRRPQRPDIVARFTGTEVAVDLDEAIVYELDGEDRPPTKRLRFTIEPDALSVIVASAPGAESER